MSSTSLGSSLGILATEAPMRCRTHLDGARLALACHLVELVAVPPRLQLKENFPTNKEYLQRFHD
jgi:hypothetical protein